MATGLGNPDPVLLDNKGKLSTGQSKMINEAMKLYFKEFNHVDFQQAKDSITFGYEPTYQYEPLRIISINRDVGKSYIMQGHAFDSYGSGIRKSIRFYGNYKYNSKFKKFIDKWHWVVRNS